MGKFTFTQTEIPGVVVIEPQVFGDDRGYFMETYQKDQFAEVLAAMTPGRAAAIPAAAIITLMPRWRA